MATLQARAPLNPQRALTESLNRSNSQCLRASILGRQPPYCYPDHQRGKKLNHIIIAQAWRTKPIDASHFWEYEQSPENGGHEADFPDPVH